MKFPIKQLTFENLRCNERYSSGNNSDILIGGDYGDLQADEAINTEAGVELRNPVLLSSWIGLKKFGGSYTPEEVARSIVAECYQSIREDTFNQQRF